MKKRKVAASILAGLLMLMTVVGCSNKTSSGEASKAPAKQLRITFVSTLISNPYWVQVADGVKAADKELGTNTEIVGPTAVSVDDQINFIQTAIASKVDGIITMALDPVAFTPIINQAKAAGIPVVLVDTDAPKSKRDAYVGTSNKQAGIEVGKAMIKATGGNAVIGIITGSIDQANLNERIDGFKEAIKDQPNMKIIDTQASDSDLLKGTEKAQGMIMAHPDLNAFFGVGATDVEAAAKVVQEQKRTGKIKLVGFDDLDETIAFIKSGVIDATIVQKPYTMGYKSVQILKNISEGKKPSSTIVDTGVVTVTKDNVTTYKNVK